MVKITLQDKVTGKEYDLPEKGEITIGRNVANGFVNIIGISDKIKTVSKQHCKIYRNGDSLEITDFGANNGTYVNRDKVPSGKKAILRYENIMKSKERVYIKLGKRADAYSIEVKIEGKAEDLEAPLKLAEETGLGDTDIFGQILDKEIPGNIDSQTDLLIEGGDN